MEEADAAAALAATATSTAAVEETSTHIPQCCCGRTQECPFLAQNNATLAALERDIQTAARLGQVSKNFGILLLTCRFISLLVCIRRF